MKSVVYVDATQIYRWRQHLTGIQRTTVEYIRGIESEEINLKFFIYNSKRREFFVVERDDIDGLKEPKSSSNDDTGGTISIKSKVLIKLKQETKRVFSPEMLRIAKGSYTRLRSGYHFMRSTASLAKNLIIKKQKPVQTPAARLVDFTSHDTVLLFSSVWDYPHFAEDLVMQKNENGFKIGVLVHDLIPLIKPELFCADELTESYAKFIFNVLPAADIIWANSKNTRKDIIEFSEKYLIKIPEVVVIRLGDRIVSGRESQCSGSLKKALPKEYILMVGTIETRKNHQLVYQAYKEAVLSGGNMPTLVAVGGPGWGTNELLQKISYDEEVKDKMKFLHGISDDDLNYLYQNSLFVVQPAIYEGWGLPVAESLAYGKFCITSKTSSMPEIGGSLVDYVSPFDAVDLMKKINFYYENSDALSKKEDEISKKYHIVSWSESVRPIIEYLKKLV